MTWQDWVFTVGIIPLTLSLWPMLRNRTIVPLSTALITATCMSIFVGAFASLGLWLSATLEAVGAFGWFILAQYSWQSRPTSTKIVADKYLPSG